MTDLQFPKKSNYSKGENLLFRNASGEGCKCSQLRLKIAGIIKATSDQELIKELNKSLDELDILEENKLRLEKLQNTELEERRKEENEDSTEDEDKDVLEKRREDAKYSVLKYHEGSISGDKLMKKLKGNYQFSENGDQLMKNLGATG